jgi:hypothetical protein
VPLSAADPRRSPVAIVGRIGGVLAAGAAVALWALFLFRNPYAEVASGRVLTFGSLMMLAGIVSMMAGALGAHLAMYLLFALSFFPVGFYVMLGPGIFQAIGWFNLAYLAAAFVVHRGVLTAKRKGSGGA